MPIFRSTRSAKLDTDRKDLSTPVQTDRTVLVQRSPGLSRLAGGAADRLLQRSSIGHAANGPFRAAAFLHSQQTHGNRVVQRVAGRAASAPWAHAVQRKCACGGTCDDCRQRGVKPEAPGSVMPEAAGSSTVHPGNLFLAARTIQRKGYRGGVCATCRDTNAPDDKSVVSTGLDDEALRTVQRYASDAAVEAGPSAEVGALIGSSRGESLEPATLALLEGGFGRDLGGARVHTDAQAAKAASSLSADAFTTGPDIYFDEQRYEPHAPEGRRLIAHEVAHTIQQSAGLAPAETIAMHSSSLTVGAPGDWLEAQADRAADAVVAGAACGDALPADETPRAAGEGREALLVQPRADQATGSTLTIQRQPFKPPGRPPVKTGEKTNKENVSIEYTLEVVPGMQLEQRPGSAALLKYDRTVWIRNARGDEAVLRIHAHSDLNPPFDPKQSNFRNLKAPGFSNFSWEVEVKYSKETGGSLNFWHYPDFAERAAGEDVSLPDLARSKAPDFAQFFLSREEQVKALEQYIDRKASEEIPEYKRRLEEAERRRKERERKRQPRTGQVGEPPDVTIEVSERNAPAQDKEPEERDSTRITDEEFQNLSPDQKDDLAWNALKEEFSVPNVLRNLAIGLGIGLLAIGALIAAFFGAEVLAAVLAVATALAAAAAIVFIVKDLVADIVDRLRHSEWAEAALSLLKGLAEIGMVLAGALLTVGVVFGTIISAPVLIVGGLVLGAVALGIRVYLAYRDYERAKEAKNLADFRRAIERTARNIEGAITDGVGLVISGIVGRLSKWITGRGNRPPTSADTQPPGGTRPEPPAGTEPPATEPPATQEPPASQQTPARPQPAPRGEWGPGLEALEGYKPSGSKFLKWVRGSIPSEGWKIHVSADAASARGVTDIVLPKLRAMGVTHKVVKSQTALAGMGGTQQGKFITIYPNDVAHARSIARALDGALNSTGLTGPAVPGEMSIGSSGLIFTRYGGFTKDTVTNPAGVEVPDVRGSLKPPWIEDPWSGGLGPGPAPAPGGGSGGPIDE